MRDKFKNTRGFLLSSNDGQRQARSVKSRRPFDIRWYGGISIIMRMGQLLEQEMFPIRCVRGRGPNHSLEISATHAGLENCAPALATGNTVVLKASEFTPLTALLFAGICQEVLASSRQHRTGDGSTGEARSSI